MWHVDEGTLHAFLDDRERGPAAGALDAETRARVAAHLHACDVCATQLDRAGRARARAADILLAAAPEIETPPFEAVAPNLAPRAVATVSRPASRRGTWLPLAWAASLVLAIGAGWMGSLLWRAGGAARAHEERAGAATAAPTQTAGGSGQTLAATSAPGSPSAAKSAVAPQSAVGTRQEESRLADAALRSGEAAVGPRGAAQAAEPKALPVVPAADRNRAPVVPAALATPERRELAAADVAVTAEKAAGIRAGGAGAERAPVSAAAAAPTELLITPRRALGFAAEGAGGGYPGDADVAWESVTREVAERYLSAKLYLLADAPIEEIEAAPHAQPALVRVRQVKTAGTVELLQWRAATEGPTAQAIRTAPAAPPTIAGVPVVSPQTRDGGRFVTVPGTTHPVLLKAAPSVDLAALLPRVRPAR